MRDVLSSWNGGKPDEPKRDAPPAALAVLAAGAVDQKSAFLPVYFCRFFGRFFSFLFCVWSFGPKKKKKNSYGTLITAACRSVILLYILYALWSLSPNLKFRWVLEYFPLIFFESFYSRPRDVSTKKESHARTRSGKKGG